MSDDPFDLQRFVDAQRDTYDTALAELRDGRKTSHWMWFVLPQIEGLGGSGMARRYALSGLPEARAYLAHPLLGPRLRACVAAINALEGRDAQAILGPIDAMKLRACLTLFAAASPGEAVFVEALDRYFAGARDGFTLARLHPDGG